MLKESFVELLERDLLKLVDELNLYENENKIWAVEKSINNSAGNLAMHLLGNLNHFVGAVLGNSGYVRIRDDEFTLKNIPRNKLINDIQKTIPVIKNSLSKLSDKDFLNNYPIEKHGKIVSTHFMLLHLVSHFNYHLGQINYHRRLLS